MITPNPIDARIAMMQLLLADIPAPVDVSDIVQRVHAHRCLFNVYGLALAARAEIDRYVGKSCPRPLLQGRPRQ